MNKAYRREEAWRLRYLTVYNAEYWRLELAQNQRVVSRLQWLIAVLGVIAVAFTTYKWFEVVRPLVATGCAVCASYVVPRIGNEKVKECEKLVVQWRQFESEVDELWRYGDSNRWAGQHTFATLQKYVERERQFSTMEKWNYNDRLRAKAHDLADEKLGVKSESESPLSDATESATAPTTTTPTHASGGTQTET